MLLWNSRPRRTTTPLGRCIPSSLSALFREEANVISVYCCWLSSCWICWCCGCGCCLWLLVSRRFFLFLFSRCPNSLDSIPLDDGKRSWLIVVSLMGSIAYWVSTDDSIISLSWPSISENVLVLVSRSCCIGRERNSGVILSRVSWYISLRSSTCCTAICSRCLVRPFPPLLWCSAIDEVLALMRMANTAIRKIIDHLDLLFLGILVFVLCLVEWTMVMNTEISMTSADELQSLWMWSWSRSNLFLSNKDA